MPTLPKPRKTVEIGGSNYISIPKDYFRWVQDKTKNSNPEFDMIGDTVIILAPVGVPIDEKVVKGLLNQLIKSQKGE